MAKQSAAFSGPIGQGGLLELLQFFIMTRKTGRLDLLQLPAAGIHVLNGMPVNATVGQLLGIDAVVEIAKNPGAEFAFSMVKRP